MLKNGIETHGGKTNPHVLLIAPHGYPDPDNDENTGTLVREMQKILDCPVIINEVYRKPLKISDDPEEYEKPSLEDKILDLNRRKDAEMHPSFIEDIETAIKYPESTFVFWIHGIKDENLAVESKKVGDQKPLGCLIGHGQDKDEQPSCNKESVDRLIQAFKSTGIKAASTKWNSKKYRGHHPNNMNQWFKQSGNGLKAVQSIQLEFGMKGIRDPGSIEKTAKKLADALISLNGTMNVFPLEDKPDEKLVADALEKIESLCNGDYHTAMQQAGGFIIEKFYGLDPQRVIDKNPVQKKSLFGLITKLQEGGEKVPSKSWFYNARDLAAHEQIFKKRGFQIFGKLGHSHKLALLHVLDLDKIQVLATEAIKGRFNVETLKNRIREEKGSSGINLATVPTKAELAKLERKARLQLQKKAETKIKNLQVKLAHYQKCLEEIKGSLDIVNTSDGKTDIKPASIEVPVPESEREKPSIVHDSKHHEHKEPEPKKNQTPAKKKRVSGFEEWADKTVSICTGCENDCIYCWAKEDAIRRKQVLPGRWKETTLRQHDVDRKHRAYGRVAFPSTHDILPFNIDAYLPVLRKLLDAGNEVLIVSKPRIDCIKSICEAAKDFKEKILFRFTIGAMDDEILSFWEPNAPPFLERMDSLRFALEKGFRTSISTEPMLQSNAIEGMVHKLLPYVNDAMWIGKMNYLSRLKKNADEKLMERIAEIEQGQTDDMIWTIYNQFKNNPKIKWKDSIKKVVGLEMPKKPGMDV